MLIKKIIVNTNHLGIMIALSVLAASGCNASPTVSNNSAGVNATANQNKNQMTTIQQGTVGRIDAFSVGVKNIALSDDEKNLIASLAIWNSSLPQAKRNDYTIKFTVRSDEIIPIGDKLYKVGKIVGGSGAARGTVEIESEPTNIPGAKFDANALTIPVGGNLELHGSTVEVVSVETEKGKTVAQIEVYSNDYPKEELVKKGKVSKKTAAAGDEILIGDKKHKVTAVHAGGEGVKGILEISISPVN
jgi:hypothetical protein